MLWICHWPKAQESGVSQDEAWKMPRYLHCENTSQLRREHVSTGKKHQCWNSWQETIIQRELTTHTRESSSLYIILQMTPTEKQFSLNPLGWRIGTPGLLEDSDRWERFCQQLTSLEAITAYSVPSIRMVAYVMYVCVLQSDSHSQIRKKSHPMWKERKVAQNTMQILSPPEQGGLGTRLASLITMRLISVLVDRGERV